MHFTREERLTRLICLTLLAERLKIFKILAAGKSFLRIAAMFQRPLWSGSLGLLLAAFPAGPASGGPPLKIAEFATVAELETEIQARLQELEPFLAAETSFAENLKRLKQVASMLAVAAQALADHEQDSPLKAYAPDLREGAIQLARADKFAEAAAGFQAARSAADRQSRKSAAAEYDWSRLVRQKPIMEEMEVRLLNLQRALRRPKDPVKESQHAVAVAIANLATLADTHEVKDPAKIPDWEKHSKDLLEQLRQTTQAIKNQQPTEAQAHFKAVRAACVECHRQFKKEY